MRVLHVIPSVSAVHGGPSIALETMAQGSTEAGIEIEVATTDDDGDTHLDVPLGKPVRRQNVTYWYFRRQTRFYKFSLPLTRWLAANVARFDVVHIHALFSYAGLPAGFFAARHKVPYVIRPLGTLNRYGMTRHHPGFKRVSWSLLERSLVAHAACLHYTSEQERVESRELGVTTRGVIIPHGIAAEGCAGGRNRAWLDDFAPQLKGHTILLHLGRIDPKKGLEPVLDALARLPRERVGLIVAGDGAARYVDSLKQRAAVLGVSDAVIWAGFVAGEAKRALLCAADCFVLASYSENFGIAVVEAMAAGLPVIVTEQVGIYQEIRRGEAGIVVSGEADTLAQAISMLAQNPAYAGHLGRNGSRLAKEQYSIEGMTRRLIELYKDVTRSGGRAECV